MATKTSKPKNDLRAEADEVLFSDEGSGETPAMTEVHETPRELTEREMTEVGEEATGVEYYLFQRPYFYGDDGVADPVIARSANAEFLPSKRDVLAFLRSAPVGKYVLVKVVDELEVEAPAADNIVRSNPRQKKPRKGE